MAGANECLERYQWQARDTMESAFRNQNEQERPLETACDHLRTKCERLRRRSPTYTPARALLLLLLLTPTPWDACASKSRGPSHT